MDNRLFNVNGRGDEMLLATLNLVFAQDGSILTCKSWKFTPEHGLILAWYHDKDFNAFPAALTAEQCLPFVSAWLKSDDAKTVKLGEWEGKIDHDGSDDAGWRVYCEDWGYVAGYHQAICAVKPCVLWYGK